MSTTFLAAVYWTAATDVKAVTVGIDVSDPQSGALLARGTEDIIETDGKVVREARYFDGHGKVVQTEVATYAVGSNLIDKYDYRDPTTGEHVSVASDGPDHARVTFREGADVKEGRVAWSPETLHGKFIPERLLAHWDELVAGKTITFELLVASRMETIRFRGRYDAAKSARTGKPTFVVDANNFVIRAFAPDFTFVFDDPTSRRVVEYVGPSPIEIAGKRYPTVRLTFVSQ